MNNIGSHIQNKSKATQKPKRLVAWIALGIFCILSGMVVQFTRNDIEDRELNEFKSHSNRIKDVIESKLDLYAQSLWNGAAFFEASDSVSRKDFKSFISQQHLSRNLYGIQGIGYSQIINPSEKASHEKNIQNQGFTSYKITPEGHRDVYTSIVYLEPFEGRNLRAFGYDMYSETVRREAMKKASESNSTSLSGKVILVQETNTSIQFGALMYVPVYQHDKPTNSVSDRRKAIKGWIYSPFRMNDMLESIFLASNIKGIDDINLKIYDDVSITNDALMFESSKSSKLEKSTSKKINLLIPLNFNSKIWTLSFTKTLPYSSYYLYPQVLINFSISIIISLLIFFLVLAILTMRFHLQNSELLGEKLNDQLKQQLALFNAIPDSIIVSDKITGMVEDFNQKAISQYGYSPIELIEINRSDINTQDVRFAKTEPIPLFFNTKHKRKDSSIFSVEISRSEFIQNNKQKVVSVIRDISEREKIASDLLLKNEVFENSITAQSIANANLELTNANKAFAAMWGYDDTASVIGKKIDTFFANISDFQSFYSAIHQGNQWQGEYEGVRQNGTSFITRAYATKIQDKDGNTIGYQSTNIDITENKLQESQLLEYKAAIDQASNGIAIADKDKKIRFLNDAWSAMHGFEKEELIGCDLNIFHTHEQLISEVLPHFEVLEKHELNSGEIGHKHKNGKIFHTWMNTTILKDKNGNISGYLAVAEDITERKQAELELKKSKEHYKTLVENSSDAILVTFIDRIAFANSRTYSMLGYEENEFSIINYNNLIHPDDLQSLISRYIQLWEGVPLNKAIARIITKQDTVLWAEFSAVIFEWDGEPAVLSFISDVTERILIHNQIKTALSEKEILLREVHHRVKNNLQVVSSLLNLQANNSSDKAIIDALGQSRNRIRSIALVHEKLYKSGNFTKINLKEYVQSLMAELFRANISDAENIKIKTEISNIDIPLMYAIPCGLIINEIVSNSLKYAFPKHLKTELVPEVFITANYQPDNRVQLCIGDNGIGLPANYQINNTSSLGLFLIQILVNEQLNGVLDINNQKGTIFTITFNPS